MTEFSNYFGGGVILFAPSPNYTYPYIICCNFCQQYHGQFEEFLLHVREHNNSEDSPWKVKINVNCNPESADLSHANIKQEPCSHEYDNTVVTQGFCITEVPLHSTTSDKNKTSQPYEGVTPMIPDECADLSMKTKNNNAETTGPLIKEEITTQYPDAFYQSTSTNQPSISIDQDSFDELDSEEEDTAAKTRKVPDYIKKFFDSELNCSVLIMAYKNNPFLWNINYTKHARSRERVKSLQQIANTIKQELNLKFSSKQISRMLRFLRQKYMEKLKKEKDSMETDGILNGLNFLKPYTENRSIVMLSANRPELKHSEIVEILNIYRLFPHLWDTNIIENYCSNKRNESLQQMLVILNTRMHLNIDLAVLENYLYHVHVHLTKEKRAEFSASKESPHSPSIYREHMQFLYGHVAPLKCTQCERVFRSPLNFREHQIEHDSSKRLECSLCKKGIKSAELYVDHAKRHMNDLEFECNVCGKQFGKTRDLVEHMRRHTGDKPFHCDVCGSSFRYRQTLTIHKRKHNQDYAHFCPHCSIGFYTKDSLTAHLERQNSACAKRLKLRDTMEKNCEANTQQA